MTKDELAEDILKVIDKEEKIADESKDLLEKIPGAGEVEFEASGRVPMLEVQVNRAALARYNLHAAEVNKAISIALGGPTVGMIVEGNRRFDIVVRMHEQTREELDELRNLPVRVGETGMLPLSKVADFKTVPSVDPIRRDSGQRRAAIMVNLRGRDVEGFVREAELRPILMTALVASFGFVPMAIATGAGAEVQRPLAIVVIGRVAEFDLPQALALARALRMGGRAEQCSKA